MWFEMFHRAVRFGSYGQWVVAFATGVCSLTAGQMFTWPASVLPMFHEEPPRPGFPMSEDEKSWMSTTMYIVNFLAPLPAGYIMDWIGRKNTLLTFNLLAILSWVIVGTVHSPLGLYIARALCGAWSGCVYTVVPVLIGETFSPTIRGSMGTIFGIMLYLGTFYGALIGIFVNYDTLTWISIIPTIILFFNLLILPESAHYYLMKNKKNDARETIEWLKGSCNPSELDALEDSVKSQIANKSSFLQILTVKPYRKAFIITECLTAFRSLAGLSLLFTYATTIIPKSFIDSEESYILLIVIWIIGSGTSFFLMNSFGRRTLLFVSSVGSCLTMLGVAIWYYCRDFTPTNMDRTQWFPLLGLLLNGVFFSMGLVSVPILIQGEIFPVNIKAKASALACISIAFTSGLSVKLYEPLTDGLGEFSNFLLCSISCALAALFTCTYMIETQGKSIEEIQDILSGVSNNKLNP